MRNLRFAAVAAVGSFAIFSSAECLAGPTVTYQARAQGRPADAFSVGVPPTRRDACRMKVGNAYRHGYVQGQNCIATASGASVSTTAFEYVRFPAAPHSFVTLSSAKIHAQPPGYALGRTLCSVAEAGQQYVGEIHAGLHDLKGNSYTSCAYSVGGAVKYSESYSFYYPVINANWATINVPLGREEKNSDAFYSRQTPAKEFVVREGSPCIVTWSNGLKLTGGIRPFFNSSYNAFYCFVAAFGQSKQFDVYKHIDQPPRGGWVARNNGPTQEGQLPAQGTVAGWRALWVPASKGRTPEGALTPISNEGKPNYICRVRISGEYRVGRTWFGTCYVSEGTAEKAFNDSYEIAVGEPSQQG